MLQERDDIIQKLTDDIALAKSQNQDTRHTDLMKTVEFLEGQVLLLEAKCREKGSSVNQIEMDMDGSEVPVIGKAEKKVQRSAAPRASASSGGQAAENKVSELQKELREAKQALNDQQAEFEQLLAKQAEEMTAEFERSSSRFTSIEENRTGLEDLIAHLKTENEQKSENCERLKRLIVQQDEVVAEQKKVMEAQAANTSFAMENMRKMLAEAQQKLKEDMARIQSKDAELLTLRDFKVTYAQKMKDLQEDYIKIQDENEKLLKDVEQNMKSTWELKNQTTHLSRELESATFSLNSKEKMVAKMSAELSELNDTVKQERFTMGRMKNAIIAQEAIVQQEKQASDALRSKLTELQQEYHQLEDEKSMATHEVAELSNRLKVLENELETHAEVKEAEMKISSARVQRSVSLFAGETEHAMASSKAHFADLEMRLQREQQRANDAVKEANQLKLDLVLFQEKYDADEIAARKKELMEQIESGQQAHRAAQEELEPLREELQNLRCKVFDFGLNDEISRSMVEEEQRADRLRNEQFMELMLQEANGKCEDLKSRLDVLLEKNESVEKEYRSAVIKARRATEAHEQLLAENSTLEKDLSESQQQLQQAKYEINKLQLSLKDAGLSVKGLQEIKSEMEVQTKNLIAQVSALEELLRQVNSQRDILQEELSSTKILLRKNQDERDLLAHNSEKYLKKLEENRDLGRSFEEVKSHLSIKTEKLQTKTLESEALQAEMQKLKEKLFASEEQTRSVEDTLIQCEGVLNTSKQRLEVMEQDVQKRVSVEKFLRERISDLSNQVGSLTAEKEALTKHVHSLKNMDENMNLLQEQKLSLSTDLERATASNCILKESLSDAERRLAELTEKISIASNHSSEKESILSAENQASSLALETIKKEYNVLKLKAAEDASSIGKLQEQFDKQNEKFQIVLKTLEETQQQLSDTSAAATEAASKFSAEKAQIQMEVTELYNLLEAKKAEFLSHDQRLRSAESEIQALTKEKLAKLLESANMLADLHASKSESSSLSMRLHDSAETLHDMKIRVDALQNEKNDMLHKLDRLGQENASLEMKLHVNDENPSIAQLQQHVEMFKADNEQLSKLAKSMQEEKDHVQLEARKMQADIVLLTSRLEAAQAAEREALALKAKLSSEADALKVKLSEIAAAKGDTDGKSQRTELQEQVSDLLSQRELMIEELAQRKAMLEATVKEMELTMSGAEQAVLTKGEEIKGLVLLFPIFVCSYVCVLRGFQDDYYSDYVHVIHSIVDLVIFFFIVLSVSSQGYSC